MTNEQVLELIEKVQILECDDPQIIVLTTPRILPLGHIEQIREAWQLVSKGTKLENVKAVILDGGMDIKVISIKKES